MQISLKYFQISGEFDTKINYIFAINLNPISLLKMKRIHFFTISLIFLSFNISLISCSKDVTEDIVEVEVPDEEPPVDSGLPIVITNEISDLTRYSVTLSGRLVDSGDSDVTEVGIIVAQFPSLTIYNNQVRFPLNQDATGEFSIELTHMYPNNRHFVKAYAINSEGVAYGDFIAFTSLDQNAFDGDITLSTQQEVEDFGANNYNVIKGNVTITGSVTNLLPLQTLEIIELGLNVINTDNLKNFEGLHNLVVTGYTNFGGFRIENNTALENFSGLDNLEVIMGDTYVINNPHLINLEGLDSFARVWFGQFRIENCNAIQSLAGLENLSLIDMELILIDNAMLNDLSALNQLNFAERIYILNNSSLEIINGFESLTSSNGLIVENNENLTSIEGFDVLTSIADVITFSRNPKLTNLNFLQNITNTEYINIIENEVLANFDGFQNLTSVTYDMYIRENNNLNSLFGLENLNQVDKLEIQNNELLNDFCALNHLFTNGNSGSINFSGNLSNPTTDDIINNCD